jgi:hypothetical protein
MERERETGLRAAAGQAAQTEKTERGGEINIDAYRQARHSLMDVYRMTNNLMDGLERTLCLLAVNYDYVLDDTANVDKAVVRVLRLRQILESGLREMDRRLKSLEKAGEQEEGEKP